MNKPEIKEIMGGYLFTWEAEKLSISATRIRVHSSDGKVTGELLIKSLDGTTLYPQTSFNFTSDRTRSTLIKTLTELDMRWNWQDIINNLSFTVMNRARKGEPVRELWTSEDISPPEFLLEPFLYKGLPTILFGEKAVCKSTIALAIYICLTLPWYDNPLGWIAPAHPVKTLLADYEVDYNIAQWNAKKIQEGMGLPPFPLYYRRCALPLADDIEQLSRHISELGAEVLIVDSLAPAVGGNLKDPDQALRFTSALRQLKCSTLIIGQTSKDKESKVKSVFGSTMFEYYARNIFMINKVQEEGEDSLDIAIYNTYHNLGKRFKPMGFHLSFNGTGTHISSEPITSKELVDHLSTQSRIYNLLKTSGALSPKDLADSLEVKENTVRGTLKRMREKNLIINLDNGSYGLLVKP